MKPIADQTEFGYATAEKRFNEFAKANQYPNLEDLTKEHILGEVEGAADLKLILR